MGVFLYTLSEFIQTVKEDIGVQDLPLPVTDQEIISHFDRKTLRDFSIVYPKATSDVVIGNENLDKTVDPRITSYRVYKIPKWVYEGSTIVSASRIKPVQPDGFSDFYMPHANWASPDAVIAAMADVRLAAGVGASLSKSPTIHFEAPDKLRIYNGWVGGIYEVEVLLKHDLSLATVDPGCEFELRTLTEMDLKIFLYNKLKRKDGIETGVGNTQLKIDDWAGVESERTQMFREWKDESNMDFDYVIRY